MRISVIIPTFRRTEYLAMVLRGLSAQTRPADQIVTGVRASDTETAAFLAGNPSPELPLEVAVAEGPGVIAAMSAAAAKTDGDLVCLLDDDSEPHPDWLERIERRFVDNPRLGMLGGRDLLQDHPEMRAKERPVWSVGVFTWYGRILGNHHRGGGTFRRTDTLKGCNAAIRGHLLRLAGFEKRLRGDGAQVHWEVALCLDVARAGFEVAYDPGLLVTHHIAPRYGTDQTHRGGFSQEALYDMVWNEHFVVGSRCGPLRRLAHLLWSRLAGSLDAPGLLQYVRLVIRHDPLAGLRYATARSATRDGRAVAAQNRHR